MKDVINTHLAEAISPTEETAATSRVAEAKFRVGDTMRRWCFQSLGNGLKAIILTGSLARNEATWREINGTVDFFSDAEFVVVLQDGADLLSTAATTLISRGAEEELRNLGVLCKLSLGTVHESYLSRLGETIFGYELLTCGEVLYGDPELLLNRVQHADIQVSLEDGWRILANRMVELLEIVPEVAAGNELLSESAQYRLTKLYLDLATSLLVFKREFVAGYQARAGQLRKLRERDALGDLPFNADQFVEIVCRCAAYKTTSAWTGGSPFAERKCVTRAIADLLNLWSWELAQMNSTATGSPESLMKLHMRNQHIVARLRGWLFTVRRIGLVSALPHMLRWFGLFRIASPRYCVYAAALNIWSTAQLSETQNLGVDLEAAEKWLPVAHRSDVTVGNDIIGVASTILWNYMEFLVDTRS